jgi:hypothetical protein
MSLPSVDPYPRTTVSDAFTSNCDALGPDFFDEFLALNSSIKEEHNYSILSDPNFFRSSSDDSGSANTSSSSLNDDVELPIERDEGESELWTQNLTVSQGNSVYLKSSGRAARSESEILNLGGITLDSPHTPTQVQSSSSQSPYDMATFLRPGDLNDTPSKTFRNACGNGLRNPIRKANSFPKMMRTSHRCHSDLWATKIESPRTGLNFYNHASSTSSSISLHGFSTPEKPTTRLAWKENVSYANSMDQSSTSGVFDFETPLSTPVSDLQSIRRIGENHISDTAIFSPTTKFDYPLSEWFPMPSSSGLPANDITPICPSELDSPLWWNDATSAPMAQPSPTALHVNPKRATESLAVQLQNKITHTFNGLPYRPSSVLSSPAISTDHSFTMESSMAQQYTSTRPHSRYLSQPNHTITDGSSRKPRLVRKPRFGPDEIGSPSPIASPELQVRKRKTSRQTRQFASGTPPLAASVGFVNYTPDDSQKILTGVAPSGSSKTKARREKEALEKRRKLSQAAVRAVRAAGGDVKALVEEGLLV